MGSSCVKESIHVGCAGKLLVLTLYLLRSVLLSQLLGLVLQKSVHHLKKVDLVQKNPVVRH